MDFISESFESEIKSLSLQLTLLKPFYKMASLKEKIGYGLGDTSSSMFWKIFSYYLPIFYSDVFELSLAQTATLMFITRIWDTVSDPMMGVIADRTQTRWGKYRPYLLWFAAPFAIAGVLLFTTPNLEENGKLIWAYCTYILMMTVYTGINVPYASMLGVVTDDSDEKTVFSSFRMFFAYAGSFVALFAWEPLCSFFQDQVGSVAEAWQHAMIVIACMCLVLFLTSFALTKEHIKVTPTGLGNDFKSLLSNLPWWTLTLASVCTNLFNTVRGSTVAYYFKYYIGENVNIDLGLTSFIFFAGLFLAVGEVCNMAGVVIAVPVAKKLGKKSTFILSCAALVVFSIIFFYMPLSNTGFILMLLLQIIISIFTGIMSPLVWSMYADVADYARWKDNANCTGLIFSSGSFAQKLGGAVAGSAVLMILDAFGLIPNAVEQADSAILGMKLTISWIPAGIALFMMLVLIFYPLTRKKMDEITFKLKLSTDTE